MNTIKLTNVGFYGSEKNRIEIEIEKEQYVFNEEIWDIIKKYAGIIGVSKTYYHIKKFIEDTEFNCEWHETLWRHKINDYNRSRDWDLETSGYGSDKYPVFVSIELAISSDYTMENKVNIGCEYYVKELLHRLDYENEICGYCKQKMYMIKEKQRGVNWRMKWGRSCNVCVVCWGGGEGDIDEYYYSYNVGFL